MTPGDGRLDQVTLTVINNYLTSTCRDMGVSMMRTSYSPIFNESLDFSCVIFDRQGRMLAQAEFCPSQIGTIKFTVSWTIDEIGAANFRPGDVIVHNDPYRGSGHVPEHMVLKPVFHGGELFGFVANCAHMAEVGGKSAGGFSGDATDIFQEGLRLPPVRLVDGGHDVADVWKIILTNHRTPRVTEGDLRAMIGSLHLAERRLHELLDTYGRETIVAATDELMAIAERRMRAEIAALPDGEYPFEDVIEDDGVTADPATIRLRVVVRGDRLIADFTGSDAQTKGPMNAIYAVTASAVYNAILSVTDHTIPRNEGCYRPFTIIAPPGTLVNAVYPAPVVGGNTETSPRITDMVFAALAPAIPGRVAASGGGTSSPFLFGGLNTRTGRPYAHFHFEGVGWGGRATKDGNTMVVTINGNCRNTPVEVFETRYPPFVIEAYRLRTDSGGPGRWRGGLGGERLFTVVVPEIPLSAVLNRMKVAPWGLFGGSAGATGGIYIKCAGGGEWRTFQEEFGTASPSKFAGVVLRRGDQVLLTMPGGGGYGDPLSRPVEQVVHDVEEGWVSPEAALDRYGVSVAEQDGRVEGRRARG
jgi:N-methylhydantoinase B/oxoprolinase/acetone carboxylase alpha subunit